MNIFQHFLLLWLLLCSTAGMAQQTVTGKVTDPEQQPLVGVTVLLKGTSSGAITNSSGVFTIKVPNDQAELEFRYLGYASVSRVVGASPTLSVVLRPKSTVLDEVVITALGFAAPKDEMGATYSTIDSEDMLRSGETGVINAMAGKAASVRVARSNGDPGAGSTIQIRGANTITGSSAPLVIVDGIPVSNATLYGGGNDGQDAGVSQQSRLNDLNPNDIESVQILKGASAASLWGSRAANGVIVITTRKGRSGKPTITFNSTYSVDEINARHDLQTRFGQGRNGTYSSSARESWGDRIADRSGGPDEVDMRGEQFIAADGTEYFPILTKHSRATYVDQNFDQVFGNGSFWQNNLSISGGSDKATFFFSLGHLDQEGIIKNSYYERFNLRANNQIFFNDWLNMSTKAAYTYSDANRIQQSSNTAGLYLGLLRTPPDFAIADYVGTYVSDSGQRFPRRHRAYRRPLGGPSSNPIYGNPLWTTDEQRSTTTVNRFLISSELNIAPLPWLQFTVRGGVDGYTDRRVYFFPIGSPGSGRNPGLFNEDIITEREVNVDAIAKGNFSLNQDMDLLATVGWNVNDRERISNYTEISAFQANVDLQTSDLNTNNANSSVENVKRFITSNRLYGVFAFDLYDQLYLTFSGTQEAASSVRGAFFYPAFDLAWQLSRLAAFKEQSVVSFAKVRASWGQVGVQPAPHRFQTLAEGGFSYSTYSDPLQISQFGGGFRVDDDRGNPDLKPEIKIEWELGADLRFFEDRLSLSATYYRNEITNLLFEVATAPSSGFLSEYTNAGSMENRGIELETDYRLIQKRDFELGLYANFNNNRNEVTDLKGTESVNLTPGASISSRAIVGHALGTLWATRAQREEGGSLKLDANGFPQIDPEQGVVGDPNPDWRGGLGLRARWKGLRVNLLFEHSQGGDFAERTRFILRNFGTHADVGHEVSLSQALMNVAGEEVPAGTTVRGNIQDFGAGPVLLDERWYRGRGAGFGDGVINEFAITDGSWTRLRELSIGYTLSSPWLTERLHLSRIQLTATGRNLFLWTEVDGIDPEVNQYGVDNGFGLDYFTNPSTRSFLLSLSVTY